MARVATNPTLALCNEAKSSEKYQPSWLTREAFEAMGHFQQVGAIRSFITRAQDSAAAGEEIAMKNGSTYVPSTIDWIYLARTQALIKMTFQLTIPKEFVPTMKLAVFKVPAQTDAEKAIFTLFEAAKNFALKYDFEGAKRNFFAGEELFAQYRCADWLQRSQARQEEYQARVARRQDDEHRHLGGEGPHRQVRRARAEVQPAAPAEPAERESHPDPKQVRFADFPALPSNKEVSAATPASAALPATQLQMSFLAAVTASM